MALRKKKKSYLREATGNLFGWLRPSGFRAGVEERYGLGDTVKRFLNQPVPAQVNWYHYLGAINVFLIMVLFTTGIALAFYYVPTPEKAYSSIQYIMNDVSFGWLVRSIHLWATHLLVISATLHLLTIFIKRSYLNPRELVWVGGYLMLLASLAAGFTGHLLPWDQLAYTSTHVGITYISHIPVLGGLMKVFFMGGSTIGGSTLIRFYIVHAALLPVGIGIIAFLHVLMVNKQGLSPVKDKSGFKKGLSFWPHIALNFTIVLYMLLAVLLVFAVIYPAGLLGEADPLETAEKVRPSWYFLALYKFFAIIPGRIMGFEGVTVAVGALVLLTAFFLFIPFLDIPGKDGTRQGRSIRLAGMVFIVVWIVFTIMGLRS